MRIHEHERARRSQEPELEWAKLGESERQLRDAVHIVAFTHGSLDLDYLRRWSVVLGVAELLQRLIEGAEA